MSDYDELPDLPVSEDIEESDIAKAVADKTRTFYVGIHGRLGWHVFAAFIEYSFFHPRFGPNSNADFHYYAISFGIPHYMISIPWRYEKRANEIARKLKLRAVGGGVVPLLLGGPERIKKFPGADEAAKGRNNLYVIESVDRTIYTNDADLIAITRGRESAIVDTLMQRGPVMTPKQAADLLWRRD